MAPELPTSWFKEGLLLNLPKYISINTYSFGALQWRDVKIPVCLSYVLANDSYLRMDSEHVVFLRDTESGRVISAHVDLAWLDGVYAYLAVGESPRKKSPLQDGEYAGGTFVYSITHFTELPRYSAEYEVWVKIADIESNHELITVDLKAKGWRVTRDETSR